jgi:hypothetical protein
MFRHGLLNMCADSAVFNPGLNVVILVVCLREIAAYVLLLPRSTGAPLVHLRLTQLGQSANMHNFLSTPPPIRTTKCLVTLGLVFWLDGWDPSASSKNN